MRKVGKKNNKKVKADENAGKEVQDPDVQDQLQNPFHQSAVVNTHLSGPLEIVPKLAKKSCSQADESKNMVVRKNFVIEPICNQVFSVESGCRSKEPELISPIPSPGFGRTVGGGFYLLGHMDLDFSYNLPNTLSPRSLLASQKEYEEKDPSGINNLVETFFPRMNVKKASPCVASGQKPKGQRKRDVDLTPTHELEDHRLPPILESSRDLARSSFYDTPKSLEEDAILVPSNTIESSQVYRTAYFSFLKVSLGCMFALKSFGLL